MERKASTLDSLKIAVVGLGYVGLPTALAFHDAGFNVCGIDISTKVVNMLKNGESPLIDNTANLKIPINSENWRVTNDYQDAVFSSDVILITVPTPVNEDNSPNLSYVKSASDSVFKNVNRDKKTIVVLESTVYPGVTREVLGGLCLENSLKIDENICLAYCPERVNPGDEIRGVDSVAQIIGCDDQLIGKMLTELFSRTTSASSTYVGKIEIAEASKMIENVQRDIDIALVNELAIILPKLGVDVEDVLAAAATKWNFHRHTPGIGVGGHCIPVDPYYYMALANKVGFPSMISTAARKINNSMPEIAAENIIKIIGREKDMNILVLGYSYKPELGDLRETPVEDLTFSLSQKGANVKVWDSLVDNSKMPEWVEPVSNPLECREIDTVVLATAHKEILNLDWSELIKHCRNTIIYDGRRVLNRANMEKIGWKYTGIGVPE
jgi:UDP-N-acetyl-D-glucosamine/UDP-N-acetyl-D-galactosamine dehydrogenase